MSAIGSGSSLMPIADGRGRSFRTLAAAAVKTCPSVGAPSVSTNNHGR
jgi:hypothetical protein